MASLGLLAAASTPASADVDAVEGAAVGLSVNGSPVEGVPSVGLSADETSPPAALGPVTDSTTLLELLEGVGTFTATTRAGRVAGEDHFGFVESSVDAGGIDLPFGDITVLAATSRCTSDGAGSTGSSTILASGGGGVLPTGAVQPNTVIELPPLIRVVLNEQIRRDAPGSTEITVNAIHATVLPSPNVVTAERQLLDLVVAQSRCRAVGPDVLDGAITTTTTGTPPTTRTTPTVPPTVAPSPTTAAPATTTTVAGVTTTTTPPGQVGPPPPPTLSAGTPTGAAAGPAGVALSLIASGHRGCETVFFFFDGTRIGSADPDETGNVRQSGLSVPGGAEPGPHRLTSSCRPSGEPELAAATFTVTPAANHRSALVTSVVHPRQIASSGEEVATSALLALAMVLLIVFPAELFNSTLEENYDEVRGWFGLSPSSDERERGANEAVLFALFLVVGGVLFALLSPDFGFNRSTVALAAAMTLSLAVLNGAVGLPVLAYARRRYGERAELRILPLSVLVAAVCVGLSRLIDFEPGYLYGLLAGFTFQRAFDSETEGRMAAISGLCLLGFSLLAWFARIPVADAAARPDAPLGFIVLEAALVGVFLAGLEGLVFSMVPLRFLDGSKLMAWSRAGWAVLFGLVVFILVHVLLRPGSGYVNDSPAASTVFVVVLFAGFGVFSVAFWAYFRFRRAAT